MKLSVWIFGLLFILAGLAACSNTPTPAPTVPPPTQETLSQPASPNPLPVSLKEIKETKVYRFRVDPSRTSAEYAVQELLLGNNQLTRGKTNAVDGEFQLYMQNSKVYIALSNLQVDLSKLSTDNALRDEAIRKQWLESEKYPKAIFVANSVQGLPLDAVQDQPYTFQVSGDMTIRNISKPVTFDVTVTVHANSIEGEGTTIIHMRDFGFDPPSVVGQTIVSDPATITIKGVANLIEG